MTRSAVANAGLTVVKVGSSSLTSTAGGLDPACVDALVDALVTHVPGRLVLVSSGAIAGGLAPLGLARRPRDLATQQAAASVGQSILMNSWAGSFARHGRTLGQVLLTTDDVVRRAHYRNAKRTLERLLSLGVVPVVNENDTVATDEIRFGDNDRLAALVAHLVHAEALVLLSDVDGLYDGDPRRGEAKLIPAVYGEEELAGVRVGGTGQAGVGTGGMASKVEAARVATAGGVHVVVAHADDAGSAVSGDEVGTWFPPRGRRQPSRLLWLAHASTPRGRLHLDAGAVQAVVVRRKSLLPAGVVAVDGAFTAGDPVDLAGPDGTAVARGLVAYDADELPRLLGRSTHELGPDHQREVVHRDDLVVL